MYRLQRRVDSLLGRTLTVAGTGGAEGGGRGGGVEKKINMAMKRRPTGKNGGWFREVEPSYEGFDAVFQRGIVSGLVRLASLLLLVTGKCVGLTVVEELVCVSCYPTVASRDAVELCRL